MNGLRLSKLILNIDARDLLLHLSKDRHARIEVSFPINESSFPSTLDTFQVSKISDVWYLGIRETLVLSPIFQPPGQNSNATLITCFLNAVMEIEKIEERTGTQLDSQDKPEKPYNSKEFNHTYRNTISTYAKLGFGSYFAILGYFEGTGLPTTVSECQKSLP